MDQALAHLSFERLNCKDKDWSQDQLLAEISEKWFEFLDNLKEHNKSAATWFIKHRRARLIPAAPPL
jgi:hypothetical protein